MLKYINTQVVFREFPDETTLAFNISNCPIHCPDCHSKYLWKDVGTNLTIENIISELDKYNNGITCIGFMGGDFDISYLTYIVKYLKEIYPNIKYGWYSGRDYINPVFDYVKTGPYDKRYGGLDKKTTNQRFYKIIPYKNTSFKLVQDITHTFFK